MRAAVLVLVRVLATWVCLLAACVRLGDDLQDAEGAMDVLTQYRQLARKHKAVALRDGSLSDGLYRLGIAMQQLGASDDAVSTLRESAAVVAETSTRQSLAYVLETHITCRTVGVTHVCRPQVRLCSQCSGRRTAAGWEVRRSISQPNGRGGHCEGSE